MSVLDDPTLGLIARFVSADISGLEVSNESYLENQIAEIKRHIEGLPKKEQQPAALEWIKEHAERYRRQWHKKELSKLLLDRRCADCPLDDNGSKTTCIIHKRWIGLLNEYIADEINSERYIEETLRLLNEHKTHLKISAISSKL